MLVRDQLESQLRTFLDFVLPASQLRLTYRFLEPPPQAAQREFENPELIVDFDGQDAELLLGDGGELLRSIEHLAHQTLHLTGDEHEKLIFDCRNRRMLRVDELNQAALLAAERVSKTGIPFHFGGMNSRERRILHMALRDFQGIQTGSEGMGPQRHVVVAPAKPVSNTTPRKDFRR